MGLDDPHRVSSKRVLGGRSSRLPLRLVGHLYRIATHRHPLTDLTRLVDFGGFCRYT